MYQNSIILITDVVYQYHVQLDSKNPSPGPLIAGRPRNPSAHFNHGTSLHDLTTSHRHFLTNRPDGLHSHGRRNYSIGSDAETQQPKRPFPITVSEPISWSNSIKNRYIPITHQKRIHKLFEYFEISLSITKKYQQDIITFFRPATSSYVTGPALNLTYLPTQGTVVFFIEAKKMYSQIPRTMIYSSELQMIFSQADILKFTIQRVDHSVFISLFISLLPY